MPAVPRSPYAVRVEPAETQQARTEVERQRPAPSRESAAPEHHHVARPRLERLASGIGNRGFGRLVSRMRDGEGILPGGRVHPDVEAAIAASRSGGHPLERNVAERLEPSLGESLADVRVHTGEGAAALARAVEARAFTVGPDIFFARGEYRPGTPAGDRLVAHEVTHALQQRGAPQSGPLTVSVPGDALEREAEAVSRDVTG